MSHRNKILTKHFATNPQKYFGPQLFDGIGTGRSIRPEVFRKKSVLKNFKKITRKHPSQSLFFNIVAGLRPATSLKSRLRHR